MTPHLFLLVADDYGWELFPRLGAASPHAALQPSVTRYFVDEGFGLIRHYAPALCAPSRASLMTGRWPYRAYDFSDEVLHLWACRGISPGTGTIAERLKAAGYRTHMIVRAPHGVISIVRAQQCL